MTSVPELSFSHIGIYVTDAARMEDFYTGVLGFSVTDRGLLGSTSLVFLSRDAKEHHQIVLASGRPGGAGFNPINQISFRMADFAGLREMHRRLQEEGVSELAPVSHGNALSMYFKDPEGNRIELFVDTPWYTPQPCREPLDLTQPVEQIKKQTEDYCRSRARFQSHGEWQRELRDKIAASR
jgi:catechol 2,3-dioxygenase